jgi:hypothetical protein
MSGKSTNWGTMENVAAIAMHVGGSKKKDAAYDAAGEYMGGFPGFYQAAVEIGVSLEEYSEKHKITWGEQADWILTTEELSDKLLDFMIENRRLPGGNERDKLIKASIQE